MENLHSEDFRRVLEEGTGDSEAEFIVPDRLRATGRVEGSGVTIDRIDGSDSKSMHLTEVGDNLEVISRDQGDVEVSLTEGDRVGGHGKKAWKENGYAWRWRIGAWEAQAQAQDLAMAERAEVSEIGRAHV